MDSTELLEAFRFHQRRVEEHACGWFYDDEVAKAVLARRPVARARALALAAARDTVGTDVVYMIQPERWLPERSAVQEQVLETLMGSPPTPALRADLPVAVLLLGLPGSGKTSILKPLVSSLLSRIRPSEASVVDADEVRHLLPEYCDGLGSEVVQVETAYLTYRRVMEKTFTRGQHVILDTVGHPEYTVQEAEFLTESGWSVVCFCASVPVEVAVTRAIQRAVESGRYVPPAYIRAVGDRPVAAYEAMVDSDIPMIGAALFDTEGDEAIVLQSTDPAIFGENGNVSSLAQSSSDAPSREAS
jgi:predicted kinase